MVEALASLAIFSIVAAGLLATTMTVIQSVAYSRDQLAASSLIQDRVELFRSLTMPADAGRLISGQDRIGRFERTWSVTDGPTMNLAVVTVTVAWRSPQARSLRGTAYVCRTADC